MGDLSGRTAIVVGASRGLGRGVAAAFADAGASVVDVSRTAGSDASDPAVAAELLDKHEPSIVVLVAGATPELRPLQEHTWETFSVNWHSDVRIAFHWLQAALLRPLAPGSRMVVFSSGAALGGSPLSGGYAGAKATQRFITGYAQDEADRAGLDISFAAVLPKITPLTGVGRPAIRAYARRSRLPEEEYIRRLGDLLTPEIAGKAIVDLVQADVLGPGYVLGGDGLHELS
jgi:NAD(P)-dependent dehydrogenase (short-subunit alcohol dehydrogenase family)